MSDLVVNEAGGDGVDPPWAEVEFEVVCFCLSSLSAFNARA